MKNIEGQHAVPYLFQYKYPVCKYWHRNKVLEQNSVHILKLVTNFGTEAVEYDNH